MTSAVIYTSLLPVLSRFYTFKQLGGTSSGVRPSTSLRFATVAEYVPFLGKTIDGWARPAFGPHPLTVDTMWINVIPSSAREAWMRREVACHLPYLRGADRL